VTEPPYEFLTRTERFQRETKGQPMKMGQSV
jgi:hypothetical protein